MIKVTVREFNKEVLESKLPVFTCFTTHWCQSCYPVCLFTDQLTKEYDKKIKFVRIDKEENPEIAEKYNVIAIPAIIIFKNKEPVKRLAGFQDLKTLRNILDNLINRNKGIASVPRVGF